MLKYLPLLAALAACNAPDTFVLAAIASGDAAPTDVSSDAAGDAPVDTARPDVAIADAGDAADVQVAADAQVADVTSDTAQSDASADVALADASEATSDAAVSDAADASDAGDAAEASVDEICGAQTSIARCTSVRFDKTFGCGWCGGADRCVYGFELNPLHASCDGWTWR